MPTATASPSTASRCAWVCAGGVPAAFGRDCVLGRAGRSLPSRALAASGECGAVTRGLARQQGEPRTRGLPSLHSQVTCTPCVHPFSPSRTPLNGRAPLPLPPRTLPSPPTNHARARRPTTCASWRVSTLSRTWKRPVSACASTIPQVWSSEWFAVRLPPARPAARLRARTQPDRVVRRPGCVRATQLAVVAIAPHCQRPPPTFQPHPPTHPSHPAVSPTTPTWRTSTGRSSAPSFCACDTGGERGRSRLL